MPYVKHAAATRLVLPSDSHYFIMWRAKIAYGALAAARTQAIKIDGEGNAQFDANAYSDLALLAHIESWNLDDAEGKPLPLSLESLGLLDSDDVSFLQEKMAAKSKEQEKERKNS